MKENRPAAAGFKCPMRDKMPQATGGISRLPIPSCADWLLCFGLGSWGRLWLPVRAETRTPPRSSLRPPAVALALEGRMPVLEGTPLVRAGSALGLQGSGRGAWEEGPGLPYSVR